MLKFKGFLGKIQMEIWGEGKGANAIRENCARIDGNELGKLPQYYAKWWFIIRNKKNRMSRCNANAQMLIIMYFPIEKYNINPIFRNNFDQDNAWYLFLAIIINIIWMFKKKNQ